MSEHEEEVGFNGRALSTEHSYRLSSLEERQGRSEKRSWFKYASFVVSIVTLLGILLGVAWGGASMIGDKAEDTDLNMLKEDVSNIKTDISSIKTKQDIIYDYIMKKKGK